MDSLIDNNHIPTYGGDIIYVLPYFTPEKQERKEKRDEKRKRERRKKKGLLVSLIIRLLGSLFREFLLSYHSIRGVVL
jgi:hypothetical protein